MVTEAVNHEHLQFWNHIPPLTWKSAISLTITVKSRFKDYVDISSVITESCEFKNWLCNFVGNYRNLRIYELTL